MRPHPARNFHRTLDVNIRTVFQFPIRVRKRNAAEGNVTRHAVFMAFDADKIVKVRRGDNRLGHILPGIRPVCEQSGARIQMPLSRTQRHRRVFNVKASIGPLVPSERFTRQRDDLRGLGHFSN